MMRKWRTVSVMAASLTFVGSALAGDGTDRRSHSRGFGRTHSPAASYTHDPYAGRHAAGRIWGSATHGIVIPARYETIYEKVWIEPVYEWVTHEVWVPARRRHGHIDLNVGKFSLHLDLGKGRHRGRRGYYETVQERVLVHEGYYETVAREVLVRNGRRHNVHRYAGTGRHDGLRFAPKAHHGRHTFKSKSRRGGLHRSSRR